MSNANKKYDALCKRVERVCGCRMSTPKDFQFLTAQIYLFTNHTVSEPTLRRIWGYQDNGRFTPRPHTLNVLANYVGYNSWDDFCRAEQNSEAPSSDFINSNHFSVTDLRPGDYVRLIWRPDRCVVSKYEGRNWFIVEETVNSKLRVGDKFTCHTFIQNEPLYLEQLLREGAATVSYVCGQQGGVQYEILGPSIGGGNVL